MARGSNTLYFTVMGSIVYLINLFAVQGQVRLSTTSPSRLRRATSPSRGGFGSPRKVNGFARGSPTRGNNDDRRGQQDASGAQRMLGAATRPCRANARLRGWTKTEPSPCRKVRLVASLPVSFCRSLWYTCFAALPAHFIGKGVRQMPSISTFILSVAANVASYYICKWLDGWFTGRKH